MDGWWILLEILRCAELAGLFCVGGESWVLQISFVDVVGWMRTVLGVRFGGVVKWCWCCYLAIEDWSRIFFFCRVRGPHR